jgi:hypothetical protein
MFDQPERSWRFLTGAYLSLITVLIGWSIFLLDGPFADSVSDLHNTEGGSIVTLLLNLPLQALVVVALARLGRFRLEQLGADKADMRRAARVTAALWVAAQTVESVVAVAVDDPIICV